MSGCTLCGRPARTDSRYCCRDHENLFSLAQKELGRIPMSLSEAEAVFNLASKSTKGAVEQLPLIPNRGR
jgi:hypothetical protein